MCMDIVGEVFPDIDERQDEKVTRYKMVKQLKKSKDLVLPMVNTEIKDEWEESIHINGMTRITYPAGFHTFLTVKDAEDFAAHQYGSDGVDDIGSGCGYNFDIVIIEVECSGLLARGECIIYHRTFENNTAMCEVYKYMKLVKVVEN